MKHTQYKYFLYLGLFWLAIVISKPSVAQADNFFNPILFNGRIYPFNPYNLGSGNPFFTDATFRKGKIFIQGKPYETLMNYDIQQQEVIIYYPFFTQVSMISVPKELVDSFYFQKNLFIRESLEGKVVFLEKTGKGSRYFFIKHQKVMGVDSRPDYLIYSQNIKSFFWFDGSKKIKIKNKRSFLKLFAKQDQQKIKSYLRKNHFKFKKATSDQWQSLANFINKNIN